LSKGVERFPSLTPFDKLRNRGGNRAVEGLQIADGVPNIIALL
jgi:hypothetical protein